MTRTNQIKLVAGFVAALVLIQLLNTLTLGVVSSLGIVPRSLSGLLSIPLAPFIHHSWGHLFSNLVPLALLTWLALQNGLRSFSLVTLSIIFLGGLGVWLVGGRGYHAGASLLVFGYWGYLIALALFRRKLLDIAIAVGVLALYGGLALSLFKYSPHISWSSHFFGLVAGVMAAWLSSRMSRDNK